MQKGNNLHIPKPDFVSVNLGSGLKRVAREYSRLGSFLVMFRECTVRKNAAKILGDTSAHKVIFPICDACCFVVIFTCKPVNINGAAAAK